MAETLIHQMSEVRGQFRTRTDRNGQEVQSSYFSLSDAKKPQSKD